MVTNFLEKTIYIGFHIILLLIVVQPPYKKYSKKYMGVCIGAGFPNFVMYWLQLTCLNWVVFHILLFSNILFMELETEKK